LIRRSQFLGLALLLLLGSSRAAEEKKLAVYSPQTNFTVPVFDHDGHEYVSLIDLVDPFGRAELIPDKKRWRLKLEAPNGKTSEGEFTENSSQAKLHGKKLTLAAPYWMDSKRGYIPLSSAHIVLSQFLGLNANLRENSRRLFLGEVGASYSLDLQKGDQQKGSPAKLVLHFTTPVNPSISTEPGKVRLTFTREPLVAGANNPQTLEDPIMHSATFSEANGASEIVIATSAPVIATFGDMNKTITLAPAPVPVTQAAKPAVPVPSPTVPVQPGPTTPVAQAPIVQRFVVIIDPAHGGDDPGEALGNGLFEKDVTLAIARRIRNELDQRGIAAVLLREGDDTLTADQRAASSNASRNGMYVAVHVDTAGSGVRLYSARLSPTPSTTKFGFVPWNAAQSLYLDQSHNLIASMISEFDSRRIRAVPLEAGLRPLRNISKPAIAVEVAPAEGNPDSLTLIPYQQSVATAIASGIANIRKPAEGGQ
jgi:N-acetylmuramoyl-L-alanine amidase